jgi:hypothetical protein
MKSEMRVRDLCSDALKDASIGSTPLTHFLEIFRDRRSVKRDWNLREERNDRTLRVVLNY